MYYIILKYFFRELLEYLNNPEIQDSLGLMRCCRKLLKSQDMHHVRLILLFSNFQIPPDSKKIREINSYIDKFFCLDIYLLSGIILNNIFVDFLKYFFHFSIYLELWRKSMRRRHRKIEARTPGQS